MLIKTNSINKINPTIQYWSATSLEDFFRCPRGWFLERNKRKKITTPPLAKGTHCHSKGEELRLHHLRTKARYKSAESFGNVIANDWQRGPMKEGKIRGNKILWEYETQPYVIKEEIRSLGKKHYPILMGEEPPILFQKSNINNETPIHKRFTIAHRFKYIFQGRALSGEIDEIRPNHKVRDYKTGKWGFIEKKLEFSLQPTYYLLTFCILCNKDETFREMMGVKKEEAEHWAGNPDFISERIKFEYYMLDPCTEWDKEKKEWIVVEKSPIIEDSRSNFGYKNLCQRIDTATEMLTYMRDQNTYPAFPETCIKCSLYKEECNKMTENLDINRRQMTLWDYINASPKTKLKSNLRDEKVSQAKFDFMNQLEKTLSR